MTLLAASFIFLLIAISCRITALDMIKRIREYIKTKGFSEDKATDMLNTMMFFTVCALVSFIVCLILFVKHCNSL
jgi:hypothetical protein